jgi:hypothetical protein
MNAGEYRPHSDAGKKLLAHELTHVIQQRHGMGGAPGASHEHEADATSDAVAGRGAAVNVAGASGVGIARQGPGAGAPAGKGPTITPDIRKALLEELQRVRLTCNGPQKLDTKKAFS